MEGNEEEKEECKNKMIFNPCYNSFKYSSKTPVLNLYVYYYQPHLHISSCGQHHIRGIKLWAQDYQSHLFLSKDLENHASSPQAAFKQ